MKLLAITSAIVFSTISLFAQTPQRTTADYDDWTLRCEYQGTPSVKNCDIAQKTQIQGQTATISQIAMSRPSKNAPLLAVLQVPINVWLPAGVKLIVSEKEPPLTMMYKRCLPAVCLADMEMKDDLVKKLRSFTGQGKIIFQDAGQRDVTGPLSFKGFADALDALAKE